MSMQKRKFTKQDKLTILQESKVQGVKATLDKHALYPATFYSWKHKYESMGEQGLSHGMTPAHLKEIRRLEKENTMLKQIIAEKELEGRLKDELLKKKYALSKKRKW